MSRHAPAADRRRLLVNGLLTASAALAVAAVGGAAANLAPDAHAIGPQKPTLPTAEGTSDFTRATLTPDPAAIPRIGALPPETVTETSTRTVTATRTGPAPRAVTVTATRTATVTATQTVTSVATSTATETATATVTVTETQQGPL
ncbi:MAG: hypothetical protein HOV66_30605, partial [Streptomycetaceae bacterium]|nr:hypothetical protein [Streptomycetaceae bacterium]